MSGEQILVADDDPTVVAVCADVLAEAGYQVHGVCGGQEALRCLEGERFDLLLLDLKMPVVDGLTVLRRARELDPGATAVIVTSYGTIENAIEALQAGARDLLLKPFEPDDLLLTVEKALATRRQEQENLLLQAQLPILKASQLLMSEGNVESLAGWLLEVVVAQIGAERALLLLLDEESDELYAAGSAGLPAEGVSRLRLPAKEGIAGQAQRQEDPLLLAAQSPASRDPLLQALAMGSDTAVVCVPLRSRKKALGLLSLSRPERAGGPPFTRTDLSLLSIMGSQITNALENARLFEEVRAARERLENLSRRLLDAQETERRSIARELHDEIGQALTVIKINLQAAQGSSDMASLALYLADGLRTLEGTLQQVRGLSLELRPSLLDDLGLVPALRWYVDRQAQQAGVTAHFASHGLEERLPPEIEIACFRIVQEALTNVMRHADASQVFIELRHDAEDLHLAIRDDGLGFDVPAALAAAARGESVGLLGMEERVQLLGGRIEIESAPGQGTEIRVCLPEAGLAATNRRQEEESRP
jgi:signal transduction histidine kinase/CheY-like chemotaxis protein